MAFVSDSTVTPARRLLPVRDTRGRFVKPPLPSVAELLAEIDEQEARPELPTPPLLAAGVVPSEETPMAVPKSGASSGGMPKSGNTPDAIRPDTDSPALSRSVSNYPDAAGVVADRARALHLRRQLEAAAEFGADLLAALGLPRLVGPDFRCVDIGTAGDALDSAIAALDALDGDSDLEDGADDEFTGDEELSLGWTNAVQQVDLGHGRDDDEPTLGAPERSPWVPAMGHAYYEPANGSRPRRVFTGVGYNQVRWSQGSRMDGEGEACIGYDTGEDSTPCEDGLSRPWLCEERVIGMRVEGDCCAPHILDGGVVHADKGAQPVAGDFVTIFFESWQDGRQCMRGWVKRLSMNLPPNMRWPFYAAPGNELSPVLMVEALNPPQRFMLDVTKVHAVFKVVTILPPTHAIRGEPSRPAFRP